MKYGDLGFCISFYQIRGSAVYIYILMFGIKRNRYKSCLMTNRSQCTRKDIALFIHSMLENVSIEIKFTECKLYFDSFIK